MELSFEFFPPKTEQGQKNLKHTWERLAAYQPNYYSVTFGAGGSTRDMTLETVTQMRGAGLDVAPHMSCICASRQDIDDLLQAYAELGVTRLVVLRGDIPSGMGIKQGDFAYANELVSYIREQTADQFHIEVGCYPEVHPQAKSSLTDMGYFKQKVAAGADGAITQFFYHPDAYYYFLESCAKADISVPITPGIMPIYDIGRLQRFASMCGAEIPLWLIRKIERYTGDEKSIRAFTQDFLVRFCEQLLAMGAPGLHFYTLNKSDELVSVLQGLGLSAKCGE